MRRKDRKKGVWGQNCEEKDNAVGWRGWKEGFGRVEVVGGGEGKV